MFTIGEVQSLTTEEKIFLKHYFKQRINTLDFHYQHICLIRKKIMRSFLEGVEKAGREKDKTMAKTIKTKLKL
jgi:hypothetical protein